MVLSSVQTGGVWIPEEPSECPQWLDPDVALSRIDDTVSVIRDGTAIRYVTGGSCHYGKEKQPGAYTLLAQIPALKPEQLGGGSFCRDHGLRYPCYAGSMAMGISSVDLVAAMIKAGMLGFFGSGGISISKLEEYVHDLSGGPGPWGANLLHRPDDPQWEEEAVQLFMNYRAPFVEASAYLRPTANLVRLRLKGLHEDNQGHIRSDHCLFVKLSRVEVAASFVQPPPEKIVKKLFEEGKITAQEARLAPYIPMAHNITVEADSGGHTDHRSALTLFPTIKNEVCRITEARGYTQPVHVGLGGGIGTPAAAAAAFTMGAAYIVTGSVNQAAREAGTSTLVKKILAQVKETDLRDAPAADLFERGGTVQIVGKGLRFAERAKKLYDCYRRYDRWDKIPELIVNQLEKDIFRKTLEDSWGEYRTFLELAGCRNLEEVDQNEKLQMALLFRTYLSRAVRWALVGKTERRDDFQIWCGPSMGAFNAWAKGSWLEDIENRSAPEMALQFLYGAARLIRLQLLHAQGIDHTPVTDWFKAKSSVLAE